MFSTVSMVIPGSCFSSSIQFFTLSVSLSVIQSAIFSNKTLLLLLSVVTSLTFSCCVVSVFISIGMQLGVGSFSKDE